MNERKEHKRSFKTNSISDLAKKVSNTAFRRYGFAKSDVLMHWPEIVGKVLAKSSIPERLVHPKSNDDNYKAGTLYIRVEGSFAPEMQHMQPLVIDRINSYYGFKAVDRLIFRHGPVGTSAPLKKYKEPILTDSQENELNNLLSEINDDALRESLYKVGAEILSTTELQKPKQAKRFTRRGQSSKKNKENN